MRPKRLARQLWRGAALASLGLAGGAAVVTARHLLMTPQPLESGLPGEGRIDRLHGGDVYYSVAGPAEKRPVVLLHGLYPGASNYEFRAIFPRLAETHRVYAPDWLGFGMSERPPLTHTGEFYAASLNGFLRDVVGAPAMVVAHGLAANIAVRAAADAPDLFDRLTLVAPEPEAGMRLDPTLTQTATRLLQKLALGMTPYAIVSLRPALRLAEGLRSAVGPMQVDDATLDHLYASAHQFGGEHALLSLLTGELDLPIRQVFPVLAPPTLIVVGARDARHPLSEMERLVALNPYADLEVIANAGETVYLDQPTLFAHLMRRWMDRRVVRHEPAAQVSAPAGATAAPAAQQASQQAREELAAAQPEIVEPEGAAGPPVKVVPVLDPPRTHFLAPHDAPHEAQHEVQVARTPDGEALASGAHAASASQPLTLEQVGEPHAEDASDTPDSPQMRVAPPPISASTANTASNARPAPQSRAQGWQGGAYHAPQSGGRRRARH